MGRRKRPQTKLVRIRLIDLQRVKRIARQSNLSIPDTMSEILRRKNEKQTR